MSASRARPAFTLVELVVYCGLLSIFAVLFIFSLPFRDNASLENLTSSVEESGFIIARMHRDLSNSANGRAVVLENGQGIAFPSPLNSTVKEFEYDSSGTLLWRCWVVYMLKGSSLNRYELPLERVVTLDALGPFPGVASLSQAKVNLAASGVVEFRVEQIKTAYQVTLSVDFQGERVRNVSAISPRN